MNQDLSLKEVVSKGLHLVRYLKSKMIYMIIAAVLGAIGGYIIIIKKDTKYTATLSFVLESNDNSSSMSSMGGLASMMGIQPTTGSGLFQGKSLMALYTSRLMVEKTLFDSLIETGAKRELLIDRYLRINDIDSSWVDVPKAARDEVLKGVVAEISNESLSVTSDNLIKIKFEAKDEIFAKTFVERLVDNVNAFYIITKTKKSKETLKILEKQADSVRRILNSSISGVASSLDANPNPNPAFQALKVPSQRRQVDVQAASAIYGEVVRNIQASKMALQNDTPLIQIVDQPVLPLDKKQPSLAKGVIVGALFGIFMVTVFFLIRIFYVKVLSDLIAEK